MGAKREDERGIRIITQNDTGTYSVTLPIGLVRKLKWRKGQKVVVSRRGKDLIVKDWKEN